MKSVLIFLVSVIFCAKVYSLSCVQLFEHFDSAFNNVGETTVARTTVSHFTSPHGKSVWVRIHHTTLKDEIGKPLLMFEAELEKRTGKMTFSVLTRNEVTGVHYDSGVFATSLFWMAINRFGAENIQIMVGDWILGRHKFYDPALPYSTHTQQYSANLNAGQSKTDAAKNTWMGRLAEQIGLKFVDIVGIEETPSRRIFIVHFQRHPGL